MHYAQQEHHHRASHHNRPYNRFRRPGGPSRRRNPRSQGKYIDPALFVKKAVAIEEKVYEPQHTFADFALDDRVQTNLHMRKFSTPTAIQDQAINPILEGRDVVGIANTGTGKTAAFLLPLISKVAKDTNQRVLIVTPTRELAVQIEREFIQFSRNMSLYATLCIGGTPIYLQRKNLARRPQFVIGTPGRIKDLQERGILHLDQYNNVVLDEVDRMLDMGFINDIKHIVALLGQQRQSLFFSATLPESIRSVMQTFLKDPVTVSVKTGNTSQHVDQDIVRVQGRNKMDVLHDLLVQDEFKKVLVFGRTKWGVKKLEEALVQRGLKAVSIHGNKTQSQRLKALRKLHTNEATILFATDVVARGIDIKDITHVINYDIPDSYEDYIHRIGRTGRAGKKGFALTFLD